MKSSSCGWVTEASSTVDRPPSPLTTHSARQLRPPDSDTVTQLEDLLEKIRARTATVGVIGLGYVGLPLALLFEESGFSVIGFDVDPKKAEALGRGESYIRHIGPERVAKAFGNGRISATSDFGRLPEYDTLVVSAAHREFRNPAIYAKARLVVDTWNMLPKRGDRPTLVRA